MLGLPSNLNKTIPCAFMVLTLIAGTLASPASAQNSGEQLPIFRASDLLPNARLSGPNYRVNEAVINNGFLNIYSVTVDGHSYEVAGNAAMKVRLNELAALQQMEAIQRTDVYKKALKTAAMGPLRTVKGLVVAPVDTVKGIASGVKTFFGGIGHAMFGETSEQEEGVMKTALGFDVAKRKFADKFGIDPYTSFPPVRERLNEISWAGVGGSLTVSGAFQALPSPAKGAVGGTKSAAAMNSLIRDNTPNELNTINENRLKAMKVSDGIAELFLEHPKFSPTEKTLLVDALALVGVHNRETFIKRAVLVQDEAMAFFMRRWAQMTTAYHVKIQPAARFVALGKMPMLQRADGIVIGLLPVDYLAWSEGVARRHATNMNQIKSIQGVTGGELWFEGSISPQARKSLEAQNWVVKDNVTHLLGLN